jgi:UDP-N-acetylmuramoyl-L-alanyl-D-glutamate--2,6-diaminopimelate ligase
VFLAGLNHSPKTPDSFSYMSISLQELIQTSGVSEVSNLPDVTVAGITQDSRQVKVDWIFVAVQGEYFDGHQFITDAVQRGAVAVCGVQPLEDLSVPYIRVPDSRVALAYLSAAFYGFPARHLTVIGITGTDGKTTTANLIYHLLRAAGLQVGMISTVNALIGDQVLDTGFHVTTPESPQVQAYLARMVDAGTTHVILEATSHGLAQERVTACDFDIGVLTNITHEHLDYHGSYQEYRAAKARLFSSLGDSAAKPFDPPRIALLNRDDRSFEFMSALTPVRCLSCGLHSEADIRAEGIVARPDGLSFTALGRDLDDETFHFEVRSNLVGSFNVANCLAAVALGRAVLRLDNDQVALGISALPGIPGRMESIDLGQDFTALVDFAHTPNSLRRALESVRSLTEGRVIVVFGSAGLRDREKRHLMAQISAEWADLAVLTAEDPRSESLEEILAEMAAGAESKGGVEGRTFWRVPDRGAAIRHAVDLAQPGDLVIACGKGHEQSMCFGQVEFPWDDRTAMRAAISALLNISGPKMPYLPTQDEPSGD